MSGSNAGAVERTASAGTNPVSKLRILCYVPAYNAAATIPSVLDRIPENMKDQIDEILVVDNASEDNTHLVGIGYAHQKGLTNLKVHRSETNGGYGGSQKVGYRYAIDNGFDVVVMLHGDGQYAPEKMEFLLEPIYQGKADHVFGSRMTGDPRAGGIFPSTIQDTASIPLTCCAGFPSSATAMSITSIHRSWSRSAWQAPASWSGRSRRTTGARSVTFRL
jgi:glycosyltransferase involved in cell wall biosynthesis